MKTLLKLIRDDVALSRPCIAARKRYKTPTGYEWWRPILGALVWLAFVLAALVLTA